MRRTLLAMAVAGLVAAAITPRLFAADAPPAAPSEDAIPRLIEDLGSDDFRVREAATKALTGFGEKARPALESAMKSDNPAVRFRAEQILDRLKGAPREQALGEGTSPGAPRGDRPRDGAGRLRSGDVDAEMERLRQEMDRRMRELEESFRMGRMDIPWGRDFPWGGDWGTFGLGRGRGAPALQLRVDGGASWAELVEGPRGARIVFTAKDDPTNVTTFAGASVAKILESRPQVREWPGAKELLERYGAERAAREEAAKRAPQGRGTAGVVESRSVQILQTPDGVKVTVTQPGPDGVMVTKSYEGADLETIKREHPEIADALGGFSMRFGTGPRVPAPPLPPVVPGPRSQGERPLGPMDEDEDEPALPIPGGVEAAKPGPYGLALGNVDDRLRSHLKLAEGEGALVLAVRPDSPAAKAGLLADDVIVSVNGAPVTSLDDVGRTVRAAADKSTLTFEVFRGGARRTLPEARDK